MANRASFLYKPPLYINGCKERLTRKIIVALNVVMSSKLGRARRERTALMGVGLRHYIAPRQPRRRQARTGSAHSVGRIFTFLNGETEWGRGSIAQKNAIGRISLSWLRDLTIASILTEGPKTIQRRFTYLLNGEDSGRESTRGINTHAKNVVIRVADYMHIIKSLLAHAPIHSRRTTLSHYARSAIVI